jgi:hypothetical protein
MCRTSSECYEGELERPLCVCVFHYDYFPVASYFLLLLLQPTSSSSRQTRQPSSHMCLLSLSLSLSLFLLSFFVVECSTRTMNERTDFFFLFFSFFFFLFTGFFLHSRFLFYILIIYESRLVIVPFGAEGQFRLLQGYCDMKLKRIYINICIQNEEMIKNNI